jgi:replicative DNA helicase
MTIPDALEPERLSQIAVLASVLVDNVNLDEILLDPDDFEWMLCAETFEHMQRMRAAGEPITEAALGYAMPKHSAFFHEIVDAASSEALVWRNHVAHVRQTSIRRRLRANAAEIVMMSDDITLDDDFIEDKSRSLIDEAFKIKVRERTSSADLAPLMVASIGKATTALPTPWSNLTRIIRGFRPGGLYVIGARPGIGKSALALQIARELERYGHVAYFSLEMSAEEVTQRLIAQASGVSFAMVDGSQKMPDFARAKVDDWLSTYTGKIIFNDKSSITMPEVRAEIRTMVREFNLSGVIVDYLQLMNTGRRGENRQQEVAELSRNLKTLAMELKIPIIALSQLNRNSENRADGRPMMADLRESGAIEQDADAVLLLHRDREEQDAPNLPSVLEVNIAKSRQGPQGFVTLTWHGDMMIATED